MGHSSLQADRPSPRFRLLRALGFSRRPAPGSAGGSDTAGEVGIHSALARLPEYTQRSQDCRSAGSARMRVAPAGPGMGMSAAGGGQSMRTLSALQHACENRGVRQFASGIVPARRGLAGGDAHASRQAVAHRRQNMNGPARLCAPAGAEAPCVEPASEASHHPSGVFGLAAGSGGRHAPLGVKRSDPFTMPLPGSTTTGYRR
jgi:hypothetical protein